MGVNLAAARGLFGGWIVAATVPWVFKAETISAWAAIGLGNPSRWTLCCIEIMGAFLFAFERTVIPGMGLLITTFLVATFLHLRHGMWPWWLAGYTLIVVTLAWMTKKRAAGL